MTYPEAVVTLERFVSKLMESLSAKASRKPVPRILGSGSPGMLSSDARFVFF